MKFLLQIDSLRIHKHKRSTGNACNQAPSSGVCLALIIDYYYNKTANTCNKFVYGGCGGNDNNFPTGEECTRICGGTVVGKICIKNVLNNTEVMISLIIIPIF